MKYRFNFSYEDLSIEKSTFLRGDIVYSDSDDFVEAITAFKLKHPDSNIKGIVINKN